MHQYLSTPPQIPTIVADIRSISRELVREFGLMNKSVAGTDLSLSAVHAIIEIGKKGDITSSKLGELLHLEKSTISRLVQTLIIKKLILEKRSSSDGRVKLLYLTNQGIKTLGVINRHADNQVTTALNEVDHDSQINILKGLKDYTSALKQPGSRSYSGKPKNNAVVLSQGYRSAIIADTVKLMHAVMYEQFEFGASFEARVSRDMADFITRLDTPQNEIWHCEKNSQLVGSISIDGENLGNNHAHLRWFVVASETRGSGIGKKLLQQALEFCDRNNFQQTHLWTIKGLDAARNLYEKSGFELVDQYHGDQWGKQVIEQKFVRTKSDI